MLKWNFNLRPLLWIVALIVISFFISLTWERYTSYDDGFLGTASFLVLSASAFLGKNLGFGYTSSVIGMVLFLVVIDFILFKMHKGRSNV